MPEIPAAGAQVTPAQQRDRRLDAVAGVSDSSAMTCQRTLTGSSAMYLRRDAVPARWPILYAVSSTMVALTRWVIADGLPPPPSMNPWRQAEDAPRCWR
jgi:hypothetical protein